jgi:RNA-directed DNA polymerase
MNNTSVIDKIHFRLEDYNNYFYGSQSEIVFHFNQNFFVHQLLSVVKVADLKVLLKTKFCRFAPIINAPIYYKFSIPKRNGKKRDIQAPEMYLKITQARLNFYLQNYYQLIRPKGVFGFVINPNKKEIFCNIVENAKLHVNKKYVLNLDLEDFFSSIKAYQVKELFLSDYFRYDNTVATIFALLTTYEGKLPTGAPTSPAISNFICLKLDQNLLEYCENNNLQYSRYADDLTFSSNKIITKLHIENLVTIITNHHFKVNNNKTRLKLNCRKQSVTGIVVNEKVNVDRKVIKLVRAMLYDTLQNGIYKAALKHFKSKKQPDKMIESYFLNRLDGYINFIAQVRGKEDPLVVKFRESYNMIFRLYR